MNIRNIDLNLLLAFDAIFEEQNITRAAGRLNITQPAMSNSLNRLRDVLNDPLFVRTSHGMRPTPRARQLSGPIRNVLDQVRDILRDQWVFEYSTAEKTFKIAMSDYSEMILLPRLSSWLQHVAPGIDIEVVPLLEETLPRDLQNNKIDLAIGFLPYLESGFYCQRVILERFVSVIRNDHPSIRSEVTMEEYVSYLHVAVGYRGPKGTAIDQALDKLGQKRRVAVRVHNFGTIPPIINRTEFMGDLPLRMAQQSNQMLGLKIIQLPFDVEDTVINQFWHERVNNDPAHQWLRRAIKEICNGL